MSETTNTEGQEALSDEDRVVAMFGLDDAQESAPQGDAGETEQAEQAAAPGDPDQPETEDAGDGPQDAATTEPPAFWSKEAKEHWAAIPPSTQAYLVHRESERDAEVKRAQTETVETRRAAQQLTTEIAQERAYLTQQLGPAIQEVTQRLNGEFSPAAMRELAIKDPAGWAVKHAERENMIAAHAAMQAEQQRTDALVLQGELARLEAIAPEFREQDKRQKLLSDWAAQAQPHGFTPQELAAVKDHRVFSVLRELASTKAELAAMKAAKELPARKAVQPVVGRPPLNANRARPETGSQQMGRRQILDAARSGDSARQIAAVEAMFGLKG